ncbi:MAG: ABC transporter ATP-binding protein/permease [Planctomycetaceae bacterium]|nr:ABC transporter ATP-binding protein/permease [Planctomycetaceae bacterium]
MAKGRSVSDSSTNTFHKVISDAHFFGKSLIASTLGTIASAVLLVLVILGAGGIAELVSNPAESGLKPDPASECLLDGIVDSISLLHAPGSALTTLVTLIIVALCVRTLLRTLTQRSINRHVADGVNRLREHIQRHAIRSNPGDLTGQQRMTATALFKNTAQTLQNSARRWGFLRSTCLCDLLVLLIVLMTIDWRVGLECLIPIVICWIISGIESERFETSNSLLADQVERGLEKLTSDLDKARIVAGYGMENLELDHFRSNLEAFQTRSDNLIQQRARGRWTALLIQLVMIALPCILLARHIIFGEAVSLPAAAMIAVALGFTVRSLGGFQRVPKLAGAGTVSADEINQYLLRVPPVSQVVGARFLEPMTRSLQFNQVSIETESNPDLIHNLDLKIEAGERVALLAISDLESEALVSLIPRFSDPTTGQVLIDGQDIRKATLESLRAEAVVVGGSEPVFSATVLDNVTAGQQDISRQDAVEACKITHAENFIRQLPKGYETPLGTDAISLDAGQVFRLSLARAIARKPALLVIQEPIEALDTETKTMLDDTYQRICSGRTVIFLPSRLSTVKKSDRVVVIHEGRVAADGKHEELVRSSELYRHWEYMRFNVFRSDRQA